MSTIVYAEVLERIQQLAPAEQLRLLEELASLIRCHAAARHSILELKGLGREIWQGVDAQEYVDRERASWNG